MKSAAKIPSEFTCDQCSYSASSKAALYSHRKVHAEKKLCCDFCDYKTQFRRNLTLHNRTHSGEKPFICEFSDCDYSSSQAPNLAQHVLLIHSDGKPFRCKTCSDSFKSKHHLNTHVIAKHKGKRPHQCLHDGCEYSSTKITNVKKHMFIHTGERPFRCYFNECDYACTERHHLTVHIRTHTGERPNRCSFKDCEYSSARFVDMERHALTHSGQKPHRCNFEGCSFASARESSLKNHLLRHLDRNEPSSRPLESRTSKSVSISKHLCKICEFKTRKLKKYNAHVQSHREQGHLFCLICDFVTLKQKRFEKHMETHGTTTECEFNSCKTKNVTPETVHSQNSSCNNNSSLTKYSPKVVKKSETVGTVEMQLFEISTKQDSPKHKTLKRKHHFNFNSHPELQHASKKRTQIQPGLELESLSSNTYLNHNPSTKNSLSNLVGVKTEEESSVEPSKSILPTCAEPSMDNIDCTDSVLQVKVEQCKKYSCPVCDFDTKKKSKYKDHVEFHQNVDESAAAVAVQLSRHDVKLQVPENCENGIKNLDGNEIHYCFICEYKTNKASHLTRHIRVHTEDDRLFPCTFSGCNYSSANRGNLMRHLVLKHSDEKPFCCQLCGERFRNRQFLNSHVRNHKGKRPICCQYKGCEYSCTSPSNLKGHIRTHTLEKPYHCYFKGCDFSCSWGNILQVHIRTHTGEKPYHCQFKNCNYSAAKSCTLRTHLLTHTKNKPFRCDFNDCKFSTAQSIHLKFHMIKHMTQTPHACQQCKFRFRTPLEIEQHLETHHKLQDASNIGHLLPNGLKHDVKSHLEFWPVSSSTTQTQPSLLLEPPATQSNLITSRNKKTSLPIPRIQKEEESTAGVEGIEDISPTNAHPSGVKNDLPQSFSQVKAMPWKKYSCPICEFGTKKKSKYKDHVELHQQGHLICSLCDFVSLNGKLFEKHLRAHRNNLRANIPNVQLSNKDIPLDLDVPPVSLNSLSITCSDSDEITVDDSAAVQLSEFDGASSNRKVKENVNVKKTLCCSVCDFKTQYKGSLTRHVRIHIGGRNFSCTYSGCNHSSRRKDSLIRHLLLRHSDEKPYCCQLCGERFQNRQFLNSHVRNHKGKRPICCTYLGCEFSCTLSSDLKRHILTHTGDKPYHCDFEGCGFSCNRDSILKRHIGTHTGYRPHPCTFKGCNRSFRGAWDLKTHMLTHTGGKPFHCDFNDCKFSTAQSGNLKGHMLLHLTQNPHTCPECKFRYRTPLEIEKHLETHHKLPITSPSSVQFQPNAPTRENPAEYVCNNLRVQTEPLFISQNNNETNSITRSKKYLCAICDFESKSKKNYNAHLDSHEQKNTNETLEVSFTSPNGVSNENSSQTENTPEVVKKSVKVNESPDNTNKMNLRKPKRIRTMHHFKKHSEFQQFSSSSTHIQPSLLQEPPATLCNLNSSRRTKASLTKSGTKKEEVSSAAVNVFEGILPTNAQRCVVKNDLPQSVSPVKVKPWKRYSCPICEFGTKKKRKYKGHVELHQKEGHLFCSLCDFVSLSSKKFKKHLRTHENGECDDNNSETQIRSSSSCSEVPLMRQETSLDTHSLPLIKQVAVDETAAASQLPEYGSTLPTMEEKGTLDEQKCFKCSVCDYKTQYKHHLTDHARIHTGDRPFSCTYSGCNYSAAQKGNVMTHFVLIHSKEMPYACQLCGEAFRNRQVLNSHVRNHKGKKPICCLYKGCEFSSFLSYDLKRHIRTHTLEKPHHCDFEGCVFSCSRKFTLKAHLLTHTGGRPYRCTFKNCNFSAIHSSNLKTHSFIHTKVKPFRCDFSDCEFSCAQSGHLKLHIMQHLSQTPHACPHCKFRSRTQLEIEQHLETHHKLQNTSPSWDQPDAKIRESPAKAITNIMRVQIQPPFISQNNNEKYFETQDEARPRKKYVCARCDFESKSHKKYKAHLDSHMKKRQFLETRDTKLAKRKINSKQRSEISSTRSQGKENSTALLRESKKLLVPFPCNFCKKSFAKEMKLLNHLRYHTGQKMPGL